MRASGTAERRSVVLSGRQPSCHRIGASVPRLGATGPFNFHGRSTSKRQASSPFYVPEILARVVRGESVITTKVFVRSLVALFDAENGITLRPDLHTAFDRLEWTLEVMEVRLFPSRFLEDTDILAERVEENCDVQLFSSSRMPDVRSLLKLLLIIADRLLALARLFELSQCRL